MVKATKTELPDTGAKPKTITKAVSLIKKEELTQQFGKLGTKIAEYEQISVAIVVDDKDKLTIAENHAKGVQGMLNDIELVRKTMKGPYFETGKAIDAYAKNMIDPLDRSKKRIQAQITAFKELQAAAERARIESEQKEREEKENAKAAEIEKLERIKKQLYARIYGGIYYLKNGTQQSSAGCITVEDCDNTLLFIQDKFPSADSFVYLKIELEDTKVAGIAHLTEHKSNLISMSSSNAITRKEAAEEINLAKNEAEVEAIDEVQSLKHNAAKDAKAVEKQDERILKETTKGIRENVKFDVEDAMLVPSDFKVVDETKVNEYIRNNKDRLKIMLKNNEQPFPGLRFYVETKFVTSG